jgi:hypothetical protein
MKLRNFLDAAYALLVEEYQRIGVNLIEAVERVNESLGLTDDAQAGQLSPSDSEITAQNERALKDLQKLMAGV